LDLLSKGAEMQRSSGCGVVVVLLIWQGGNLDGCASQAERLTSGGNLPADAELGRGFQRFETDLQTLVLMSNEDANIWRIAPNFTYVQDSKGGWPRQASEQELPTARWEEYRRLLQQLGLKTGLIRERMDAGEGVFFPVVVKEIGTVDSEEKGYVYIVGTPSPLVLSLDEISIIVRKSQPVYKKLKANWYLYWRYNE